MSRRVLLVDTDVDALGALASALRARGILVANASDAFEAVEQAFQSRPDVVLVDRTPRREQDLVARLRGRPRAHRHRRCSASSSPAQAGALGRRARSSARDLDHVISRIAQASPRASRVPLEQELRGNLEQMPMVDLLQLLTMNRRSGVLGITTALRRGRGAPRRGRGDRRRVPPPRGREGVLPPPRRARGSLRVLAGRAGGRAPAHRRRRRSSSWRRCGRSTRCSAAARELAADGEALLLRRGPAPPRDPAGPSARRRRARARGACSGSRAASTSCSTSTRATDLAVLEALVALDAAGRLRRVPIAELTTPFAPLEQLPVLRSLVTRLTRAGFAPPPRLVIAAGGQAHARARARRPPHHRRGRAQRRAAARLAAARCSAPSASATASSSRSPACPPTTPSRRPGRSRCPARPRSSASADAGGTALEAHCEAVEVMLIDAESVMGSLDVAVPGAGGRARPLGAGDRRRRVSRPARLKPWSHAPLPAPCPARSLQLSLGAARIRASPAAPAPADRTARC